MPRGIRKEDEELPLATDPWQPQDFEKLHKLVRDYDELESFLEERRRMRWLQRKLVIIFAWWVAFPAALIYFFEPLERLWKLAIRLKGH